MYDSFCDYIKEIYKTGDFIPLHAPVFRGNEKKYLNECIDSTFVSSVGKYVDKFEEMIQEYTEAKKAVSVVNGTNALQIALKLVGVDAGTEVITQPLTFVATCNAISYLGASPVFVDVDLDTMGLSPESLRKFLEDNVVMRNNKPFNKKTDKFISACVPMHTFGHPVKIDEIIEICDSYNLSVVEDAAESLGSYYNKKHTGRFGKIGVFSFNGNKIITTGGGGMLVTDDLELGNKAKYITTTAKVPHKWEFFHDEIGYNYRMPNINAALGCAQMESLDIYLKIKREIAQKYIDFFKNRVKGIDFFIEPENAHSNYWLNAVIFKSFEQREEFLQFSNNNNVMTRPVWKLMTDLPMFSGCFRTDISNAEYLEKSVVNIPSGVVL